MDQKCLFSILFFAAVVLGSVTSAFGQTTPRALLWEPEFSVNLPSENDWRFTLGVANRYLFNSQIHGETLNQNEQQHFEINQFTSYKTSENFSVSLGFRYRFREAFKDTRQDEFRMIQQLGYKVRGMLFTPAHRVRVEQRIREINILRLRYRLGVSQPLGEEFGVGLSTEFLYSIMKDSKPEADHRFTVRLENSSFRNLELSAGVELRREDFSGAPSSEFYLLSGAILQL